MIYIKLILTMFFWGGTFIAGRSLAGQVEPQAAAFLRFAIASAFLLAILVRVEGRLPGLKLREVVLVMFLGLTGVFSYNIFFFTGLSLINANRASLIIATNPIFISLLSALIFREPLSPLKILGLLLSVTGAMTIISDGNPLALFQAGVGRGEMAIFGCVVSWVAYSLMGKPLMNSLSSLASVCYSSMAGTLLLLFPALSHGLIQAAPGYTFSNWAGLFYLGFFGTVLGFFWYYDAIRAIGPMKAGVFINLVPVSAILLSFLILEEPVTLALALGGALVISGVYLTNSVR